MIINRVTDDDLSSCGHTPSFSTPEIEVYYIPNYSAYVLWYDNIHDFDSKNFNMYEDAICYAYNMACNGVLDLSLESIIKLTKEYNKV